MICCAREREGGVSISLAAGAYRARFRRSSMQEIGLLRPRVSRESGLTAAVERGHWDELGPELSLLASYLYGVPVGGYSFNFDSNIPETIIPSLSSLYEVLYEKLAAQCV